MKENLQDLKRKAKDLEEILLGMETGQENMTGEKVLPKLKALCPMDYEKVKKETDERATQIVESVILMYLPPDFIQQEDYIFQKMEVDKLTLSNLLFQMRTAEHALKRLLEEIDNGSTGARSFEVLASLQKSKMEIIKHLAAFMVTMENNYKNLKFDYYGNNVEKKLELPEATYEIDEVEDNTKKFRGTKSLMQMVQGYVEASKTNQNDPKPEQSEQSESDTTAESTE